MGNENHGLFIFFNEQEVGAALERLQTKATTLEQKMSGIGDKSSPEFLKLQNQLDNTTKKIGQVSDQLSGKLAPSLKQVEAAVRKAYNEMQNLPIGSPEWKAKVAEFDKLNASFIKLKTEVGSVGKVMQGFASQVKTIAAGVLIGNTVQAGAQALLGYFQGMISGTAKIADELSDIQKTTGLTNAEVRELNKELSKIDTRTSSSELRGIAAVGGQFNIARNQLAGFTEAIDKANVALGDEFGGNAEDVATQLSKLRNIFSDVKTDSVDQDLLHIGNALNALGNAGAATSDVVADFSNRIAGVGIPLGLSTDQVLGISATLQELGVNAERGGTAVSKILQKMTVNVDEFAKVAGISTKEFTDLLNNDLYKAFTLVVEGSGKAGGSATALANLLKDAELSGAGAAEVFLKLSSNTALMGDKVKLAGTALKGTDSIMQEFNSKNNNFAANLEKIQKRLAGLFAGFGSLLEGPVANLASLITVQDDETAALERNRRGLEINLIALQDVNLSADARKKLIEQTNEKYGEYLPHLITEKDSLEDINKLQEESNKLLKTKILTISFQKELTKVFEEEAQSIEALAQAEINAAKLKAEAGTGKLDATPGQLELQRQQQKDAKLLNEQTIANTEKLAQAVRDKFKLMARFAGVAFEDLEKVIGGVTDRSKDKVKALGVGPTQKELDEQKKLLEELQKLQRDFDIAKLSDDQKEIARLEDKFKELQARAKSNNTILIEIERLYRQELDALGNKQFENRSEKEYQASLNAIKTFYEKQKFLLKEQFAQQLIDEETYRNAVIAIHLQELATKVTIAEDYKSTAKTAAADVSKFKIDADNAVLDEHIRVNKVIADDDEKLKKKQKKDAEDVADTKKKNLEKAISDTREYFDTFTSITDSASQLQKAFDDNRIAKDQQKLDSDKQKYKDLLDSKQITQAQYDKKVELLEKQKREKEKEIKKEQFTADKAANIVKAIMNTALAISATIAENGFPAAIPFMILAGVSGAAAIATIAAQPVPEFGKGGKVKGKLHSQGGNLVNAEVDEWFINRNSSRKYDALLDAVNRDDTRMVNQWFMKRPAFNISGALDSMKVVYASNTSAAYDDKRLRKTLNAGFVESSKYIVSGIVNGLNQTHFKSDGRL